LEGYSYMKTDTTQLSNAERLAIAREPGNEKLLAAERKRLRKLRASIKDRSSTIKLDLFNSTLDLLRCDADTAPMADAIEALLERREHIEDEAEMGRLDYLADLAVEAVEYLRKRMYVLE
jgi:hypothetical protein